MRAVARGRSVKDHGTAAPHSARGRAEPGVDAFFVVITPHAVADDDGARALDALAYVLLVGAGLSFGLRGRQPYVSYGLALACVVVYLAKGYGGGPIYIAAYPRSRPRGRGERAARMDPERRRRRDGACRRQGSGRRVVMVDRGDGRRLAGRRLAGRSGCRRAARSGSRAGRAGGGGGAQAREESLRRAAEERLRMAREVHDVVGHSLAVISLQAGVAAHLLQTRPERARAARATPESCSSSSDRPRPPSKTATSPW